MSLSSLKTTTHADRVIQAKAYYDVVATANGPMAFEWWLANMDGAGFLLLPEEHHTSADVTEAKSELQRNRDVVGRITILRAGEEAI
jgi:hypothetical protein